MKIEDQIANWFADQCPVSLVPEMDDPSLRHRIARQLVLELMGEAQLDLLNEAGGTEDRVLLDRGRQRITFLRFRPTLGAIAGVLAGVCATISGQGVFGISSGWLWIINACLTAQGVSSTALRPTQAQMCARLHTDGSMSRRQLADRVGLYEQDPDFLADFRQLEDWRIIQLEAGNVSLKERFISMIRLPGQAKTSKEAGHSPEEPTGI